LRNWVAKEISVWGIPYIIPKNLTQSYVEHGRQLHDSHRPWRWPRDRDRPTKMFTTLLYFHTLLISPLLIAANLLFLTDP